MNFHDLSGKNLMENRERGRKEGMEMEMEMESYRVGLVPTIYHVPDFVTHEEEHRLIDAIYKAPVSKWKVLKNRRLQNWGGVVHEKGLVAQQLPPWLTTISTRISDISGLFPSPINHVLINEYLPHQGIMPHQDGPAYYPVVAILSLGSPVVMDFTPHLHPSPMVHGQTHNPFSILLMPRSLLLFKDDAYSAYLHGIKDSEYQQCDQVVNPTQIPHTNAGEANKFISRTTTRVSLTCRTVTKVHKNWLRV